MKIVFGTGNPHKVLEVNEIASGSGIEFILPQGDFAPEENGVSFEENSLIKSKFAAKLSNHISLADDSGLCIDSLNGAPGLHSARYAGSQEEKISKILSELEHAQNRNAKFVCCMSLVDKDGNIIHIETGECKGQIIRDWRGNGGFGYDPIFLPDGYSETLAQMSEYEKNLISHRGKALRKMIKFIKENIDI